MREPCTGAKIGGSCQLSPIFNFKQIFLGNQIVFNDLQVNGSFVLARQSYWHHLWDKFPIKQREGRGEGRINHCSLIVAIWFIVIFIVRFACINSTSEYLLSHQYLWQMSHQMLFIWLASSKEGSTYHHIELSCQHTECLIIIVSSSNWIVWPLFAGILKIHSILTRMILINQHLKIPQLGQSSWNPSRTPRPLFAPQQTLGGTPPQCNHPPSEELMLMMKLEGGDKQNIHLASSLFRHCANNATCW